MITKKCSKCEQVKEVCFFSKNNTTKDKLHCSCKECDKKKYFENRERNIVNMRNYKKNNSKKLQEYYLQNQENYKQYRKSKKDLIKVYMKEYYLNNLEKRKKYLESTKQERNLKRNISEKKRRNSDSLFKLKIYVRNRIGFYLKKNTFSKRNNTFKIVGCSPQELKIYLEQKFIYGMSWNNQGEWHIDHIIPLSSAKTEEELYKLCHFTNLQPLWATDNIQKGSKII
jgi:hypothetical protein